MKKKLLFSLLAATILAFSFTGCGSDSQDGDQDNPFSNLDVTVGTPDEELKPAEEYEDSFIPVAIERFHKPLNEGYNAPYKGGCGPVDARYAYDTEDDFIVLSGTGIIYDPGWLTTLMRNDVDVSDISFDYMVLGPSINGLDYIYTSKQHKEQAAEYGGYYPQLKKVYIMGDKFTVFGKDAFKNCSELEYINIPDSLTKIADGAFYGCDKLPENIRQKILSYNAKAFDEVTEE